MTELIVKTRRILEEDIAESSILTKDNIGKEILDCDGVVIVEGE